MLCCASSLFVARSYSFAVVNCSAEHSPLCRVRGPLLLYASSGVAQLPSCPVRHPLLENSLFPFSPFSDPTPGEEVLHELLVRVQRVHSGDALQTLRNGTAVHVGDDSSSSSGGGC
jgi:hypothetical protein